MKLDVKKIEILLAEKELTKAKFAEQCGVARQNISSVLQRGSCEPITAGKLARSLGVSVSDIIDPE